MVLLLMVMLKNYIKSKANVKFADDGNGNFKVTKIGKGAIEVQSIADDERWYDFETSHTIVADKVFMTMVTNLLASADKAKDYLKALYANSDDVNEEIEKYFNEDDENLEFDDVSTEDLLDPEKPAPWEKSRT